MPAEVQKGVHHWSNKMCNILKKLKILQKEIAMRLLEEFDNQKVSDIPKHRIMLDTCLTFLSGQLFLTK